MASLDGGKDPLMGTVGGINIFHFAEYNCFKVFLGGNPPGPRINVADDPVRTSPVDRPSKHDARINIDAGRGKGDVENIYSIDRHTICVRNRIRHHPSDKRHQNVIANPCRAYSNNDSKIR